jgi:hypothetical protein
MIWAANSYFDALEGDNGNIAAFAKDCVRHEQGYQTVNWPPPGGRMMPGPALPNPNTEQGKSQLAFSMLTCTEQIDGKTFAYMKHIRPRRALIVDEQKGLVATFPLFVHDGTRRGAPADASPGMIQNLITMETFGIRDGLIHEVEVFPFVTVIRLGQRLDDRFRAVVGFRWWRFHAVFARDCGCAMAAKVASCL